LRFRIFATVSAAALLLPLACPALALDIPADLKKQFLGEGDGRPRLPTIDGDTPDNSLDPAKYLVGGGDAFQISIVGLPSEMYTPVVDVDGNLYDAELGLIQLGKIPLAKARQLIQDKVKRILRKNYDVYVTLRRTKKANVTVTGAVTASGTYQLPGTYRLLDALKFANGGLLPSMSKCDFRKVAVRNGDTLKYYDLMRFFSKQDMDQNPYVYPGDNVYLSQVDARIFVSGEVLEPVLGWIPVLPGESVADVVSLLNLKQTADSNGILVQQASSPSAQSLKRLSLQEAASFRLQANDLITIASKGSFRRSDTVQVAGEVRSKGTYPILSSRSSVKRILELAGGPTELGDTNRIVIIRHRKSEEFQGHNERQENLAQMRGGALKTAVSMQTVRPEVSSSINDLQLSGDYTLISISDPDDQGVLQDGDEIYVPRRDDFVYVSGNVKRPGAYPFAKGANVSDYIKRAGGYTDKADSRNQFLMANYDGVTQIKGGNNVTEGDLIVVPAAVEYKRLTSVYFPMLQVITGVLSLGLTVMILNEQMKN
jgi:protein involved in polysaccharide export with SLBB domain